MKNLIVQIYVDTKKYENPNLLPSFDELSTTSFILAKHYAEEVGADYLLLTDVYINHIHPTYERFRLFEESKWTDEYDQVLYLDSDVLYTRVVRTFLKCIPRLMNSKYVHIGQIIDMALGRKVLMLEFL